MKVYLSGFVFIAVHFGNVLAMSDPSFKENELIEENDHNLTARSFLSSQLGPAFSPREFEESNNIVMDSPTYVDGKDPIEGDYFEGDIMGEKDRLSGKNGIRSQRQMWTGGIIPYTISNGFSQNDRLIITNAIDVYHKKTCIKFVPKNSGHSNWIKFTQGSGCSSYIGMSGRGSQDVSLGRGCVQTGIVQHELMHAAGFWHEQSRHDRDRYVTIHWNNIQQGLQNNFNKVTEDRSQTFGQSYDYGSVMHYGQNAFAINRGQPTISPKQSGVRIGQRSGLSTVDLAKLNAMYKCGGTVGTTVSPTTRRPTGPKECKDISTSCAGWARKMECDKNPSWMKKNCPEACKTCPVVITNNCKDKLDDCEKWGKQGYCDYASFSGFMTDNCPKTCKICGDCM